VEEEYFTLEVGRINDHIKDCIKQRRITFELIKDYLKEEDFFLLGTLCELFSYNTKIKSELEFLLENMPINEKINSSGVKLKEIIIDAGTMFQFEALMMAKHFSNMDLRQNMNISTNLH